LLQQAETERERSEQVAALLAAGKARFGSGDWSGAVQALQQLLALIPGHEEAQQLLAGAASSLKQEQEAHERQAGWRSYELAREKMTGRDWAGAGELFETIGRTEPGYRDVKDLLEQVRTEKARRDEFLRLVARGKGHLEKREWTKAIGVLQQALVMDPEDSDVKVLLIQAEKGEQVKTR
jgi:tetratricopeptide (TPR) repeat protein